jgi:hypothetical protein
MTRFLQDLLFAGTLRADGIVTLNSVDNAAVNTNRFLVLDNGVLKFRTGTQLLSDIGAQSVLTNPITGTGANGQIAFWNGTNTQTGDSGLVWNNSVKRLELLGSDNSTIRIRGNTTGAGFFVTQINSNSTAIALGNSGVITGSGTTNILWSNTDLDIFTNSSNRVRIASNGNVLINTTTDAGFRLDVNGTARITSTLNTDADAVVNGVNIGRGAGNIASNTRVGTTSLNANTTGNNNTSVGFESGRLNQGGFRNSSFGALSLWSNLTGNENTNFGFASLYLSNSSQNSAFGVRALFNLTSGASNSAFGLNSLQNNTTGSNNVGLGNNSGNSISGGTNNTITNNSIFLGVDTRALANDQTNQIVIGHNAIGLGSNTTVLGNSSTSFGRWWGNLLLGTSTNTGQQLQVVGTTLLNGLTTIQGTTASDTAPLGAELLTTGTGDVSWTGTSFATGYTHVVGSVTTLTSAVAAVVGTYYQIFYTVTGRTAGSFTIAFGGSTFTATDTGATGPVATTTGSLVITPTTDFNGTIVLSIRTIGTSSATTTFRNSAGAANNEMRVSNSNSNVFFGVDAGRRNTTGLNNIAIGPALRNNTTGNNNIAIGLNALDNINTGSANIAIGSRALQATTTGSDNNAFGFFALISNTGGQNNAFGYFSLLTNTTGNANTAIGNRSLQQNLTANNNTAVGERSLQLNTTGGSNTAIGATALANNTTGINNVALGSSAGRTIADGNANSITDNSIFLGTNTRALANNQTNQIVIGFNVTGLGSNTTVLGNASTLSTAIYGDLLLGQTTDNGTDILQVTGTSRLNGSLTVTGSTTAVSAIARGANFTPTLVAAANNDVLVGLDIAPTFTNGSFNGVSNFALRVQGPTQINSSLTIGNLLSVLYNLQNQEVALFQRAGSYGPVIRLGRTGITNATTIDYPTDGAFGISTSGTEKFRIFNNGNVVIQNGGTFTDAGFRLDVNGSQRIGGPLVIQSNDLSTTQARTLLELTSTRTYTAFLSTAPIVDFRLTITDNNAGNNSFYDMLRVNPTINHSVGLAGQSSLVDISPAITKTGGSTVDVSVLQFLRIAPLFSGGHRHVSLNYNTRAIYINPTFTGVTGSNNFVAFENSSGFVFLNSTSGSVGIGFGAATPLGKLHVRGDSSTTGNVFVLQNSTPTTIFEVANNGNITASSLAGTGTRMLVANSSGVLSAQAIPTVSLQGAVDADKNTSGTLPVGTTTIKTLSTSVYSGAFFDYVVINGSNRRVGTVVAISDGTNVEYFETFSDDLGSTSNVSFIVDISGGTIRLRAVTTTTGFSVIVSTRAL